jgi:hypothetical protein
VILHVCLGGLGFAAYALLFVWGFEILAALAGGGR